MGDPAPIVVMQLDEYELIMLRLSMPEVNCLSLNNLVEDPQ